MKGKKEKGEVGSQTALGTLISPRSSLWSFVAVAFATIDRSVRIGFEGDFTFVAAFGAYGLVHLAIFSV